MTRAGFLPFLLCLKQRKTKT